MKQRLWTDWKEQQGGMWDTFVKCLNECEENIELLDTSVTGFVTKVFENSLGSHFIFPGMAQAVGCLFISVFGDIQTPVNIMINDERMQKWDTFKPFMDDAKSNDWIPTIPWLWHTLNRRKETLVTDGNKKFDLTKLKFKDMDFTYLINIGKPFIFCEEATLEQLTEEQKKCYLCVESPKLTQFKQSLKGFTFPASMTMDGSNITMSQRKVDEGAFMPITKVDFLGVQQVQCILPKKVIDMYKLPVVNS